MKKQIPLAKAILLSLIVAVITFGCTWVFSGYLPTVTIGNNPSGKMIAKVREIDTYVRNHFAGNLEETKLQDAVASGYLSGLGDTYAAYYSAEEYQRQKEAWRGTVVGIGVSIKEENGGIYLQQVYENSPAAQGGMQAGDRLIAVDGKTLDGKDVQAVSELLHGEEGSVTTVTFMHGEEEITRELTRQTVEIPSVFFSMQGDAGYLRITAFQESTAAQCKKAIDKLQEEGAKGLIFDLRDNRGGVLSSVCEILNELLPEGPIVSQTDKDGKTIVLARSDAHELNMPMVVITNRQTASAAELFTAALKDYKKAKQVGETTYGKGVMQTTYPLQDGSAIKMTTAFFNPPYSPNFNAIGVKPDKEVALSAQEEQQWKAGTLPLKDDPQFREALQELM